MRLPVKITCVILIFALLTSCAAATENKDLPTKEEITAFIAGIPVSDNYIITVYDAVIDKQPTWNCDTWVDKKNGNQILSLYYVNPDSEKGHGSIYFNELGKEISMHGVDVKLVNHHVGKAVSEEPITESIQDQSTTAQDQHVTSQEPDNSLQQTDNSPQQTDNSPQQTDNSPQQTDNPPQQTDNPPQQTDNSPQQAVTDDNSQPVDDDDQPAKTEETIWENQIFSGIFVGVVVAFIACVLGFNH